jgi:hypothetical protein
MNSEKKRRRCRRTPVLIEENLTINSSSTTTKTQRQEEKHIENIRRQWYDRHNHRKHDASNQQSRRGNGDNNKNGNHNDNNDDDDDDDDDDDGDGDGDDRNIPLATLLPDETIAEKIDRVLKKINAWASETSTSHHQKTNNPIQQGTAFNKTSKLSSNYDNIRQQCYGSTYRKSTSNLLLNGNRRRSSSSSNGYPARTVPCDLSAHRPYSMTFIDEPVPIHAYSHSSYDARKQSRKV